MIENGMHCSIILITLLCKFKSFRYQYLFSANFIYHNYQILISFNLNPDPPPLSKKNFKLQCTSILTLKKRTKKTPWNSRFLWLNFLKKSQNLLKKNPTSCCMYMYIVSLYYVGLYACYIKQFILLRVSKPPSLAIRINARTTDYNHRKCYVFTHTSLL